MIERLQSKSGLVVSLRRPDSREADPYVVKFASRSTLYASTGGKTIFSTILAGAVHLAAVADSGSSIAVVDHGYDSQELPVLEAKFKKSFDPETFTRQRLIVVDRGGKIILDRNFTDLGQPPDHIHFSPSGTWISFALGSNRTLIADLRNGRQESFESEILDWRPDDTGLLTAWGPEGKTGEWSDFNGQKVWISAKVLKQRRYRRRRGGIPEKLKEVRDFAR